MTNSHKQDVIANNIANSDTNGFRRHMATFRERPMASEEIPGGMRWSNPFYDNLGGGTFVMPTRTDLSPGALETTNNRTDIAMMGDGMLAVERGGRQYLTRSGGMLINTNGDLVLATDPGARVLDRSLQPINLPVQAHSDLNIASDGTIAVRGQAVSQLAVKRPPETGITKHHGTLMEVGEIAVLPDSEDTRIAQGVVEMSNVDPTTELAAMIETQRSLEANANILRMQDSSLQRLVNEVGKIS